MPETSRISGRKFMERGHHFSLDRLMSLCYGNTVSSLDENNHMKSCKDCEALFRGIIKEQRTREIQMRKSPPQRHLRSSL